MASLVVPGIAFAIASSPSTFKLVRGVAGNWVSSAEGVATPAGLFLHTLFFLLVLWLVRKFMPRMSGFTPRSRKEGSSCNYNTDCMPGLFCRNYGGKKCLR
jgi:uncharacterized membrane protein YhiD involved in acid resistance